MLRGYYAAASGMVAQLARQDDYAHNLANANSVGYRGVRSAMGEFGKVLEGTAGTAATGGGAGVSPATLDTGDGPLTRTDRPTDLAISGPGFLVVQTAQGLAYTRDGRLQLDAARQLTTEAGDPVLGENGPITVPSGDFTVTADGAVVSSGQAVGKLRVVDLQAPEPVGSGLYRAALAVPSTTSTVHQGMVEGANVNAMQEMGRMMNGLRYYEANATALRYQDESLSTLYRVLD